MTVNNRSLMRREGEAADLAAFVPQKRGDKVRCVPCGCVGWAFREAR